MQRESKTLLWAIVIGVIIGLFGGYFLSQWEITPANKELHDQTIELIQFPGELFIRMLLLLVVPLIGATMVVGVASLGDIRRVGKIGLRTIIYYLVTTGIAVLIGMVLVIVIQPGVGVSTIGIEVDKLAPTKTALDTLLDMLRMLIPDNLVAAAMDWKDPSGDVQIRVNILGIIMFALVFGGVLTTLPEKGRSVLQFFEGLSEILMKMVHLVIWFAPIGISCLIAGRMGLAGPAFWQEIVSLSKYFFTVVLGLFIHAGIVLPLIYFVIIRKNPFRYMIAMSKALLTAFSTASSSATLPLTMECAEAAGVSRKASSFVLPLGATINMDGTALYEAVAAIFIAQAVGHPLDIFSMIIIFLTATLAAIGAAGIPQAGLVTMVIVLTAVGLPTEGIALILSIDWFLDRFRTSVNVCGDAIGAAVIHHLISSPQAAHQLAAGEL